MKTKPEWIITERLVLKRFEEADKAAVIRIVCDARVKATYMLPDLEDEAQASAFFGRLQLLCDSADHFIYGIFLNGEAIGFLNDVETDGASIELGYFIAPEKWGRGYASEALRAAIDTLFDMGFERVTAGCFEENPASRRVMEKCGMLPLEHETTIEYRGTQHRCLYFGIGQKHPQ